MTASTYPTKTDFWEKYQYLILVGPSGRIKFTREGFNRLGLFYRRHGIDIREVATLSQFLEYDALAHALSASRIQEQRERMMSRENQPTAADRKNLAELLKEATRTARKVFPPVQGKPLLKLVERQPDAS